MNPRAVFLRWKGMVSQERSLYYYLFLWSLDKFISKTQAHYGEALSKKFGCSTNHCLRKDYGYCCGHCILFNKCSKRTKPRICSIFFCDKILEQLTKKQKRFLGIDRIERETETLRFPKEFHIPNFMQIKNYILVHPE